MADLLEISDERARELFEGGCVECVKLGGQWVHLRVCLVCEKVGCCDNSPMTHATNHWKETGHAVTRSIEPGENWKWSFETQKFFV